MCDNISIAVNANVMAKKKVDANKSAINKMIIRKFVIYRGNKRDIWLAKNIKR